MLASDREDSTFDRSCNNPSTSESFPAAKLDLHLENTFRKQMNVSQILRSQTYFQINLLHPVSPEWRPISNDDTWNEILYEIDVERHRAPSKVRFEIKINLSIALQQSFLHFTRGILYIRVHVINCFWKLQVTKLLLLQSLLRYKQTKDITNSSQIGLNITYQNSFFLSPEGGILYRVCHSGLDAIQRESRRTPSSKYVEVHLFILLLISFKAVMFTSNWRSKDRAVCLRSSHDRAACIIVNSFV